MGYFSAMMKLEERLCLVVGAGLVAERKISKLLQAGAKVLVVSPQVTETIRNWLAKEQVEWWERPFQSSDVKGATLVVAATNDPKVNLHVYQSLESYQWINIVDRPDLSSFIFPAILERGGLHVSISTTGGYPGLAKKLRQKLEAEIGPEYEEYLSFLVDMRHRVLSMQLPKEEKSRLLQEFLHDRYLEGVRAGKLQEYKTNAIQLLEAAQNKSN